MIQSKNMSKILQNTAHRRKRVPLRSNNSTQVRHTHDRKQRRYYGTRLNNLVDSSDRTTDSVLWEYMCKVGKNLEAPSLLKIISHFDGRVHTLELNSSMNNLEELISEGTNDSMILKLWKTTLEAKKKQLVEHQGVVPGTPESSDDEDEEYDEHDFTFCAVQPQRISWMVSPNERNNQNL